MGNSNGTPENNNKQLTEDEIRRKRIERFQASQSANDNNMPDSGLRQLDNPKTISKGNAKNFQKIGESKFFQQTFLEFYL